jgi:zinc protease
LKKVRRENLIEFRKQYFTPGNSMLVVVGNVDLDPAPIRALLEQEFGGEWKKQGESSQTAQPVSLKGKAVEPNLRLEPLVVGVLDRPELNQAQIRVGFSGLKFESPDRYSLAVGNALLGDLYNSRLNLLLREKLGVVYSVQTNISYSKDLGVFTLATATRNEAVGVLLEEILGALESVRSSPISEEEVRSAQAYLVGSFPVAMANLGAVAARWVGGQIFSQGPDYLNEFIPGVQSVTLDSVKAALSRNLRLDQLKIVGDFYLKSLTP